MSKALLDWAKTYLQREFYLTPEDILSLDLEAVVADPEFQQAVREYKSAKMNWCVVNFDYSQLEVCMFAELSQDPSFIEALNKGLDFHSETARKIFDLGEDANIKEEYPEHRTRAKAVTFLILYGGSAYKLSKDFNISQKEAQKIIDSFFESFPGAKKYIKDKLKEAYKNGYISNIFGRKRKVEYLRTKENVEYAYTQDYDLKQDIEERHGWEYVRKIRDDYKTCLNTPIQGGASDIVLIAMSLIVKRLREAGLRARVLLNIHDAVLLEAHREDLPKVLEVVKTSMETDAPPDYFSVHLRTDFEIGVNYADVTSVDQSLPYEEALEAALKASELSRRKNNTSLKWRETGGGIDSLIDLEKFKSNSYELKVLEEIFEMETGKSPNA